MKQKLLNNLRLRAAMLTAMLCAAVGGAWAEETGSIKFGNNGVKITAASVTGDDSKGNNWTVTTVGTTSFTQNTAYSQVGSGSKPATSITFTTTLSDDVTITEINAKFGGFSGTAGTVTLKVGDATVGTGSLSGTSDVEVASTSSETGKVLTVTVTGISKGVKCYGINYTYSEGGSTTETVATPTFNPASGTYTSAQSVEINTTTPDATIYYTTDGSDPTTSSSVYSSAIEVGSTTTIKAMAVKDGMTNSAVASASYVINIVEDGVFNFAAAFSDYGSGVEPTAENQSYITENKTWTAGNVTLVTSGKYRWWNNDKTLRFYSNTPKSAMTISVPNGYVITQIVITGGQAFSANVGTYSAGTWTGTSKSVILSYAAASGSVNVKTVTVTYQRESVTVGSAGYMTYVTKNDVSFPSAVTAYIATEVKTNTIHLKEVLDAPAGVALVIKAAAGTYTLESDYAGLYPDVVADTPNLLQASDGTVKGNGSTIWALAQFDGKVGFNVVGNGVTVPAGKAYLNLGASGVKGFLTFDLSGEETAIEGIEANDVKAEIYNLAGQRVKKAQRGIYIVGGKKVFVK